MQTNSIADYLGPLFNTGASIVGGLETGAGGDMNGAALGIATTIVSGQPSLG